MTTMKAVLAHQRGDPEHLVFDVAPRPVPARGEVLVAVHAASITPDELAWDEPWGGSGPNGGSRTQIIPSHEMSGVVTMLGAGVAGVEAGDDVYALLPFARDGAAAEFVSVPADVVAAMPTTIDHDAAAAIPLAALTAWQALVDHAGLQAHDHVLVIGGAGGVGTYAVQIAVELGARVTATARQSDHEFVRDLGAVAVLDYQRPGVEQHLHDVDVVLDLVGGPARNRWWPVLRTGGVLVSIVAPPDASEAAERGVGATFFIVEPDRRELATIATLVDRGAIIPIVDRVYPLADARAAYTRLATEHHRGKIVLHITGDRP